MDTATILALTACFLGAGLVYAFLSVRHYSENQLIVDKVNKAQGETADVKKKLLGYTKYAEYLEACKKVLAEQLKPPLVKTMREYVHTELMPKEKFKLKSDATVVAKYAVDFAFSLDVSPASLDVIDGANGIGLKMPRPNLFGEPVIKPLSHQIICATEVTEQQAMLAEVQAKFAVLAKRYGAAMSTEESVRAQCKLKVLECLRDTLAQQNGVRHVPAIFADFK